MTFQHVPVMLGECMEALAVKEDGTYVDCTCGSGGHSEAILRQLVGGRLICIDKDAEAIAACQSRLHGNVTFVHSDYKAFCDILDRLDVNSVDGILIDLGVSSHQIDTAERGFSYMRPEAPLDMRMDRESPLTAYDVVNGYDEVRLAKILKEYGEEEFAKKIAGRIVSERQIRPIATCGQLSDLVASVIPAAVQRKAGHPAKKTFQAIRIEVNGELDGLAEALYGMIARLKKGGRIAVLTFHSLEDRIVKQVFTDCATDCICPKSFPVCVCNHRAVGKVLTKKPITPSQEELSANKRSQSAKLRVLEKI